MWVFCYLNSLSHIFIQDVHQELDSIHDEYLRLREKIIKQLEGIPPDSEQARFLQSELEIINQKLGGLQGLYSAYIQRYIALVLYHTMTE